MSYYLIPALVQQFFSLLENNCDCSSDAICTRLTWSCTYPELDSLGWLTKLTPSDVGVRSLMLWLVKPDHLKISGYVGFIQLYFFSFRLCSPVFVKVLSGIKIWVILLGLSFRMIDVCSHYFWEAFNYASWAFRSYAFEKNCSNVCAAFSHARESRAQPLLHMETCHIGL